MPTSVTSQDQRITWKGKLFAFFQKLSSALFYPLVIFIFFIWIFWVGIFINYFNSQSNFALFIIDFSTFFISNLDWIIFFYLFFFYVKNDVILGFLSLIFGLAIFILIQNALLHELENSIIFESFFNLRIINLSFIGKISLIILFIKLFNYLVDKNVSLKIIPTLKIIFIILLFFGFLSLLTILLMPIILWLILIFSYWLSLLPFGLDAFLYGFFNRLLALFGLQPILMIGFLFGPAGGYVLINNEIIVQGEIGTTIFLLENNINYLGVDYSISSNYSPGQYQQGFLPIFLFCYPIAGFVIYQKTKDKTLGAKYFFYAFLPLLTGITEPFESIFIFSTPILYFLNAFLVGLSFWFLSITDTFIMISSSGIYDFIFFGVIFDELGIINTNYQNVIIIGLILMVFYYLIFMLFYNEKAINLGNQEFYNKNKI